MENERQPPTFPSSTPPIPFILSTHPPTHEEEEEEEE